MYYKIQSSKQQTSAFLKIVFVCFQTQKVVLALGDYMNAKCHACIGGTRIAEDIMKLSDHVNHIVVGTPGRVNDMMERGALGTYIYFHAFPFIINEI